nr:hypothetical protein [Nonomuraea rubra]
MNNLFRPDPVLLGVPPESGGVAQADVIHVHEDLVLTLPVPHLVSHVPRIGQDGAHCALGPGDAGAVPVPGRVVRRRARDPVAGKPLGYGEQAVAVEEGSEDLFHHGRGCGIEFQPVGTLAVGGLGGVGVRAGIGQPVAVWRPAAEEAALHLGLGGHGASHADLDAIALALAHAAEHAHDQVMGLVGRVDRAAYLGYPELDSEVLEDGEGEAVLVAVEGSVWFADHHRAEASIGVAQLGEQRRRVRAALPRDRTGLVDVEELGDDHTPARLDERAGAGDLPGP